MIKELEKNNPNQEKADEIAAKKEELEQLKAELKKTQALLEETEGKGAGQVSAEKASGATAQVSTESPGAVFNPLYGGVTQRAVNAIYQNVNDDQAKNFVRIGIIVSLSYLIKQLESERDVTGIKNAVTDVQNHLGIIENDLDSEKGDYEKYINTLFGRLKGALAELLKYESSEEKQEQYNQYLPTLREACIVLGVKERNDYEKIRAQSSKEDIYEKRRTAEELLYGTRNGNGEGDYLEILQIYVDKTVETGKEKAKIRAAFLREKLKSEETKTPSTEVSAPATGDKYVLVRKDGNNFHAEIINIKDICKNLNELNE